MRWSPLLVVVAACGDNLRVLPDALVEGDPPTTVASPVPGVYRDPVSVTLTADEDATVYYTLDGTTPTIASERGPSPLELGPFDASTEIRFFAIDRDGDTEEAHAVAYVHDRLGPPPVAGLTTAYAGFGLDVRWIAPTADGVVEVVVAETADVAATIPTDGAALAVGDAVGAGTVVYIGTGTQHSFPTPAIGSHTFVAWARYDTGVYSEARVTSVFTDAAAETAQVTFDLGAETGTVVTQPAHATIAVANVNRTGPTLTFDLTVTSGFTGLVFNPKAVVTAITNGVIVGDGTIDLGAAMDLPYFELGPAAWENAAAVTRGMTVTGASDPVTIDLSILHARGAYATRCNAALGDDGGFLIDPSVALARSALPRPATAVDGERFAGAQVAADGRRLYAGTVAPAVVAIDLTEGAIDDTTLLAAAGSVTDLRIDGSGQRLYAVLDEPTAVSLVELDPATLDEVGRLPLVTGAGVDAVALELSRDGRWAAVIAGDLVHVVDLSAWVVRDAEPGAAGVQAITPAAGHHPTAVAFDAAGTTLVVNADIDADADQIGYVDLTDGELRFSVVDRDGDAAAQAIRIAGFVTVVPNGMGSVGGFWLLGELAALTKFTVAPLTFNETGATPHVSIAGRVDADGDLEILQALELGRLDTTDGTYTTIATLPAATCDRRIAPTPY